MLFRSLRVLKTLRAKVTKPTHKLDPVKHCEVYLDKESGSCAHVDGYLCGFPHCSTLNHYRADKIAAQLKHQPRKKF